MATKHYQSAYKFVSIEPYSEAIPTGEPTTCKHLDHVPQARVLQLSNFFSAQECQYYISEAENFGFESLSNEYPAEYRNNQRHVEIFLNYL